MRRITAKSERSDISRPQQCVPEGTQPPRLRTTALRLRRRSKDPGSYRRCKMAAQGSPAASAGLTRLGRGGEDAGGSEQGTAGKLGGAARDAETWMAGAVRVVGVWNRVGSVRAQPLDVSRGARVSGAFRSFDRSDFLFRRSRRPAETEALPGVAGDQFSARKGRERGKDRSTAGIEYGWSAARGSGFVGGVFAGRAAQKGGSGASGFRRRGCAGCGVRWRADRECESPEYEFARSEFAEGGAARQHHG